MIATAVKSYYCVDCEYIGGSDTSEISGVGVGMLGNASCTTAAKGVALETSFCRDIATCNGIVELSID